MSNYARISKATNELDKAERRLLYSMGLTDEIVRYLSDLLKGGEINKELQKIIDSDILSASEYAGVHRLAKSFKASGTLTGIVDAYYQDNLLTQGTVTILDYIEEISKIKSVSNVLPKLATKAIPVVGQALLILDTLNLIDKYLLNDSKLFDLKNHLTKFYDKLTNTSSDLPDIRNGVVTITMPNGIVYARPIQNEILKIAYRYNSDVHSLFGNGKNDVLFGSNGNDILIGHGGSDILIGGSGKDDYFVGNGDIIKDSDGKGRVFLGSSHQLKGGTQIEKGSKIYKGKDGVKYELKDNGDLLINDSITIENFSNDNLEIHLSEFDEINVSISDNQAVEKAGKMTFNIELSKEPELGEFVIVKVNDKTYKFVNFLETNYTFEDGVKLIHGSSATYEYTWSDDSLKEEDRNVPINATATGSDGLKVSVIKTGQGVIKDDDKDNDPDPEREYSPIVIDLDNNGINSSSLNYTINFDLDNNGFKEATGWVSGDDALLAIDKNNNGIIDNGSELFGNKSISNNAYAYTNPNSKNGFEALSEFDSNNDGIIDINDEKFANLNLLVA